MSSNDVKASNNLKRLKGTAKLQHQPTNSHQNLQKYFHLSIFNVSGWCLFIKLGSKLQSLFIYWSLKSTHLCLSAQSCVFYHPSNCQNVKFCSINTCNDAWGSVFGMYDIAKTYFFQIKKQCQKLQCKKKRIDIFTNDNILNIVKFIQWSLL